jgi:cytochrome c55X
MTQLQRAPRVAARVLLSTLALLIALGLAWHLGTPAQAEAGPSPERQAELGHLVTHDCGSCHGLTLAGGLGPALTPVALDAKPAEYLALVILHGRPGTAMPPWRPFLTPAEADWIARRLKEPHP